METATLMEADLIKIKWALEKPSLVEALSAMEITLSGLGYEMTRGTVQEDNHLHRGVLVPQLS